jgi:dephospho-CoA kinase
VAAGATARDGIPFVALTGGIGAGKSAALEALERLGAATLSSDAVVHEILGSEEAGRDLAERLGAGVAPGGRVDRDAVARVVFEDHDARDWLERYLWPKVGERIAAWRAALDSREPRARAAVVEVPLLFESGLEGVFDFTIAVLADDDLRAERIDARGHSGVASRESRQLAQTEKAERADFAVRNDGTLEELERELAVLLARMER